MVLQSSGQITLSQIAAEFGGTTPHALSEYYEAAPYVPGTGPLAFSNFYGKRYPQPPTWTTGANLANIAVNSAFSYTLNATSDWTVQYPLTFSVVASPGFGSVSSGGVLSGTLPSTGGTYYWTVRATDRKSRYTDRQFNIIAYVPVTPPVYNPYNVIVYVLSPNNGRGQYFNIDVTPTSGTFPTTYSFQFGGQSQITLDLQLSTGGIAVYPTSVSMYVSGGRLYIQGYTTTAAPTSPYYYIRDVVIVNVSNSAGSATLTLEILHR